MKKLVALLTVLLVLAVAAAACAEVVSVSATAALKTYHQIDTVYIEYSENVVAPDLDGYTFVDYDTVNIKAAVEQRESETATIVAVYTNCEPARRADKVPVEGKYVVVELLGCGAAEWSEEKNSMIPTRMAGIATNAYAGEGAARQRLDWSTFVMTQNVDVLNAEGAVVAAAGQLPALPDGIIYTPGVTERYQLCRMDSYNGKYPVVYSIALPENYDETKTYPLVIYFHGGSRALDYTFTFEDGEWVGQGANITWGPMGAYFLDKDVIYVCPQNWKNTPAEWEMSDVQDTIALVDYLKANYPVDPERVYAIGNSAGTMRASETMLAKPDVFSAYAQCNGSIMYDAGNGKYGRFTLVPDEVNVSTKGKTMGEIMAYTANSANWRDAESIEATSQGLKDIAAQHMPVYFFDGTNTQTGSSYNTSSAYVYLYNTYKAEGMTDEEIAEILRVYLADDEEYLAIGVINPHSSTKVAVLDGHDVFDWLLSR